MQDTSYLWKAQTTMINESYTLFAILLVTMGLFIWGRWRYDMVAFLALMVSTLLGIVPFHDTFTGFSNTAVVTVACVMVMTQAVTRSGIIDYAVKRLTPVTTNAILHLSSLTFITAVLSAFMNNIGALALMMPVAIKTALQANRSPSLVLMPLAFGSALGGLCTAIGTPPNILISTYRQQITGHPFTMFDFTPVGTTVAVVAIIFIVLFGWRLIPHSRKKVSSFEDKFHIEDYLAEVKIPEKSPAVGKTTRELERVSEADFLIVGLVRDKRKRLAVQSSETLQAGDILIVEASHDELNKFIQSCKLELVGGEHVSSDILRSEEVAMVEAVVPVGSRVEHRSWAQMRPRARFHMNLLAIARKGKPFKERLTHVRLQAGDVLLVQGESENIRENVVMLGLLPLIERGVEIRKRTSALIPVIIFAGAVILAGFRVLPIQVAFAVAVALLVALNAIPIRKVYESIDWSIIVLLGAMIPIGNALQTTGATDLITNATLSVAGNLSPVFVLGLLLVVTMTLSDIINNTATAVIMAPISVSIAHAMHASPDPFLITVAIGASCSFLTPIGHQNNTLVMGPGGYKFGDYIRLGLPVEIIVIAVALPMIMWVWPL